jgi:DNA-binding MarR family transcriptional regulator
MAKGKQVPDHRTFRRHVQELAESGYIEVLEEKRHHVGRKRIYSLTEKGKTVVLFLPDVQRNLVAFADLHDSSDLPAMPCESWIRLLMEKDMPTIAQYLVREANKKMLLYNFEDEQDEGVLRDLRLGAFGALVVDLMRRARHGELRLGSISDRDARKFKDVSQNDAEFRRRVREILERMKMAMDIMREGVIDVLDTLEWPPRGNSATT